MSEGGHVRAGILVTGTEVLSGYVTDRNGPWISEQLAELGVEVALIMGVGDRPEDLEGPPEDGAPRDGAKLQATIDRVEALGSELLCFFTLDAPPATSEAVAEATGGGLDEVALITREGTPFCATFEPRSAVRVTDNVDVHVDTRHLHFFDPETEDAIASTA